MYDMQKSPPAQRHFRPVLCASRRCRALMGYSRATPTDEPEEWVCNLCLTRRYFIVRDELVPDAED